MALDIDFLFGPEPDRLVEQMAPHLVSEGVEKPEMLARFLVTISSCNLKHPSVNSESFVKTAIVLFKVHGVYALPELAKFWEAGE